VLSNHFYIGEVKYKNEILPGEQPPIMERALFDAVRQKSLTQWSHRTIVRKKSDHLLTGLLFDDAGHRMIPTHATKAGVPLSLLRVDAMPAWRSQDRASRIGLPRFRR
jgi:site-specific DNA recombinase